MKKLKMKSEKLFLIIFVLFFVGCSVKTPQIGKKSFKDEDNYIIKALVLENDNNLTASAKIYQFLYKKTNKQWYFDKEIENLFFARKYKKVLELTKNIQKLDKLAFKYRIFALLELKKNKEAKKELLTYFNKKEPLFYELMSYILVKENKLNEAVEYIKSLYALNHNKNTLLALSDLLIKLKKYNEALAYLRTHLRLYGCDIDVCKRLAEIYTQTQDFENLAYIYSLMGEKDKKYAFLALKLYIDLGEEKKALNLINKYNLGDEYKLIVYETFKEYKKAANLALKLYEKTDNPDYLLKYCIYEFEAYKNKEAALEVIPKLKFLAKLYPNNDFINNFLGYLLIDFDINPKEGIEYVKKALMVKPDDPAYIDSLAWGYYKLHKCKIAWDIIKNIDTEDKEINRHKKLIKRCLNDTSKNNRKNKKKFKKRKKH
jgi:predicted Zn-dependent protease